LTESRAAAAYLISKYGKEKKDKLYPSDPKTRWIIVQIFLPDLCVRIPLEAQLQLPKILAWNIFGVKTKFKFKPDCITNTFENSLSVRVRWGIIKKNIYLSSTISPVWGISVCKLKAVG
jgi:hypothetical protein